NRGQSLVQTLRSGDDSDLGIYCLPVVDMCRPTSIAKTRGILWCLRTRFASSPTPFLESQRWLPAGPQCHLCLSGRLARTHFSRTRTDAFGKLGRTSSLMEAC